MLKLYALFTHKKVLHKVMGIIQTPPNKKKNSFSIYVYGCVRYLLVTVKSLGAHVPRLFKVT